jgi:hypothetical protein
VNAYPRQALPLALFFQELSAYLAYSGGFVPCAVLLALNHWLWLLLVRFLCFLLHSHAILSCYSHSSSVPLSRVPLSSLSLSTLLFTFQDKGYFESKIISVGTWSVGVCKQEAHAHSDLSKVFSLLSSLLCRVLNFPRLSALRRSLNMSRNVCV